jgi:integrase/recombinase XerD
MRDKSLIGPWIRRFLLEHLVAERNLARNTQRSYRDAMVMLLPFMARTTHTTVDRLTVEDLSPVMVRRFLEHLESERSCGGATRNLRLGAIHSLAKFIGSRSPEHIAWCTEVRAIPFRKTAVATMAYLEKPEIDAVLAAPDRSTERGVRDHAMLLFLYNTGVRADEAAHVTIGDLTWGSSSFVRVLGKGNKVRYCPLWPQTVEVLKLLVRGRPPNESVFLNRLGNPLTRFGIYDLVRKSVKQASKAVPSLRCKRISPHSVRHTSAVHMLRAGVDINTIRGWLGHVSLDTTHVYAEVDLGDEGESSGSMRRPATRKRKIVAQGSGHPRFPEGTVTQLSRDKYVAFNSTLRQPGGQS